MSVTKKAAPKKIRAVAKPMLEIVSDLKEAVKTVPEVVVKVETKKMATWPIALYIGGAVLLIVGGLSYYQLAFANRIYPGVAVGSVPLSGYTQDQTEEILRQVWNNYTRTGLTLEVGQKNVVLTNLVISATDPDLTYELIKFDPEIAARSVYNIGRQGNWLSKLFTPIYLSVVGKKISKLPVEVELERVLQYIRDSIQGIETEPQEAKLTVDLADNISIKPEVKGLVISAPKLESDLNDRLSRLSLEPIKVDLVAVTPKLNQTMAAGLIPQARNLLTPGKIDFTYDGQTWSAEPTIWHRWLGASYDESSQTAVLSFISEQANDFFTPMEEEVNQPARDAKFEIREGRVVAFQGSWQGREINRAETLRNALASVLGGNNEAVSLIVATTEPTITTAETNDLGINEILGVGKSNFKGSPANRRHNIKVGADTLNGILIKPQEEFSLLKTLGTIDGEHGYLQELVIKGNRTIPEYGGGLCQIGTTTFRAALSTGLPITARRNHSYRVVYYEPAGTDATIYDPAPDFKFINDTGNTILIHTRIEGDELVFEFWGKPDGRQVSQTKPRIFNIVAPAPTKIVETEDLEPGVKKCTEKPHSGADAEFTYAVTYPDGNKKSEVFKSHYIPWQEVCLLGVPKGTLTPVEDTTTPETLPTPDTSEQTLPTQL